ncbi:unnamed protein product, partial [Allacma fusca]
MSIERPETDDEGIERDSGDSDDDRISTRAFNFDSILETCTRRLGSSASANPNHNHHMNCNGTSASSNANNNAGGSPTADAHYKAVCRALVAEALELSTFLQKVAQGTQQLRISSSFGISQSGYSHTVGPVLDHDPDLDKLNFTDWSTLPTVTTNQINCNTLSNLR